MNDARSPLSRHDEPAPHTTPVEGSGLSLPPGWSASSPGPEDLPDLVALLRRHEEAARGLASSSVADIEPDLTGRGAARRRHLLVRGDTGRARAWATVYDRAAGRVLVYVLVDPNLDDDAADPLAADLFRWAGRRATEVGLERGLAVTQMDSGAFAGDSRQQRWLAAAGLQRVRTWWQMSRPVTAAEGEQGALPPPREGVVVRLVARGDDGMPDEHDLRTVHSVLETAFTDHFNSHQESFEEFCSRLREDPGHRWDHWWIAELATDGTEAPEPAGALVGTVSLGSTTPEGQVGPDGSYVAYLGVLQSARGRGVAKSLLHAVIADAARRGRDRVGLEVDADSPTGAEGLYTSMGFTTSYITQSWHRDIPLPA